MPIKVNRTPEAIVRAITEKSKSVRDFATELSDRIVDFRDFLAQLPGRVAATAWGRHPDSDQMTEEDQLNLGDYSLGLSFDREGKDWALTYTSSHEADDMPLEWKPLHEAPLKIKIAAIKLFPDLLSAIETSQDVLVKEISQAITDYDAFAASMKAKAQTKEGK